LALEQEVVHWNSVHEVAADIFKEELVTADKIPYVELSAHFRATAQSAGTGQGLLKCSCNSNWSNKSVCVI